jgi:hypothetical protein
MPGVKATWEPYEEHGRLTTRNDLPDSVFAFPRQWKEPLTDAQACPRRYCTGREVNIELKV